MRKQENFGNTISFFTCVFLNVLLLGVAFLQPTSRSLVIGTLFVYIAVVALMIYLFLKSSKFTDIALVLFSIMFYVICFVFINANKQNYMNDISILFCVFSGLGILSVFNNTKVTITSIISGTVMLLVTYMLYKDNIFVNINMRSIMVLIVNYVVCGSFLLATHVNIKKITNAILTSNEESALKNDKLENYLNTILNTVDVLTTTSKEINTYVSDIKTMSGNVVGSVSDFSASIQETSSRIQITTENTATNMDTFKSIKEDMEKLKKVSLGAQDSTSNTHQQVNDLINVFMDVKLHIEHSADKVQELTSKLDSVKSIVNTISVIAKQTNLLALNAAIESARAGEVGKGFGVVANEIKNLAGGSEEATKNIESIIGTVIEEIEGLSDQIISIKESTKNVDVIKDHTETSIENVLSAIAHTLNTIDIVREQYDHYDSIAAQVKSNLDGIHTIAEHNEITVQEIGNSIDTQDNLVNSLQVCAQTLEKLSINLATIGRDNHN
nr:methyl-accepting chemotaxis protein [uncultured Niameybacter sp.]